MPLFDHCILHTYLLNEWGYEFMQKTKLMSECNIEFDKESFHTKIICTLRSLPLHLLRHQALRLQDQVRLRHRMAELPLGGEFQRGWRELGLLARNGARGGNYLYDESDILIQDGILSI